MKYFITIFFVFLFISCCMSSVTKTTHNKDKIIISAMELFKNKKYKKSILLLSELRKKHPYSKYDSLCFLKSGDACSIINKNLKSTEIYSNFNLTYFYDKGLPHSIFNFGLSCFCNNNWINNDQFYIRNAINSYVKVLSKFSNSNYAFLSKSNILFCYERLSKYEISLGFFYYKRGNKLSAISRFLKVISFYPDVGYHEIALKYLFKIKTKYYK